MPIPRLPRPRGRSLIAVAAALLLLSGCAAATPAASTATTDAGGAFPVTITTMYGTTTIEKKPTRVATWGWGSTDAVLALGITPVAMPTDSYGAPKTNITPWIQTALDKLGGKTPTLLNGDGDLPVEKLLATNPDILIAPYSGLTQDEYDQITAAGIPVVAPEKAIWTAPWRDVITVTGRALGLDAAAEKLVSNLDAEVSKAADAHPEFKDVSIAFATYDSDTFYLYLPSDARVEILEDLGFTSSPSVTELDAKQSTFYTTVSPEKLDQIDAQVIFSYGFTDAAAETAFLTTSPTTLVPAVKRGAVAAIVGVTDSDAVSPTALTLPYILPQMVEQLAAAVKTAKGQPG